mgnify:CR=1 FL=1
MQINDILKDYAKLRDDREKERDYRISKLYEIYPEYMEMDNIINNLNIKLLKLNSNIERKETKETNLKIEKEEILNEIKEIEKKKHEFLKKHNISEKNVLIQYNCELCKDTGFIKDKENSSKQVLCNCIKNKLANIVCESANINIYSNASFDNFDLKYYKSKEEQEKAKIALNKSKEFVEEFNNKESKIQNVIFIGKTGLGKTHLSESIGRALILLNVKIIYDTTANILNKLMEYKQESLKEYNEYAKKIKEIPLLILDDFGAENLTEAKREEILNIINERIYRKNKTIISTNYTLDELSNKYPDRVVSRLIGEYEIIQLLGKDIRLQKKIDKKQKSEDI